MVLFLSYFFPTLYIAPWNQQQTTVYLIKTSTKNVCNVKKSIGKIYRKYAKIID